MDILNMLSHLVQQFGVAISAFIVFCVFLIYFVKKDSAEFLLRIKIGKDDK